jgi:hypothetical protein
MIIRKATCQRSIALIRITPSFRAEMKKQMTDWALALKMLCLLIIGGVMAKALKTHFLFSALKEGVNRINSGRFADNHIIFHLIISCNFLEFKLNDRLSMA